MMPKRAAAILVALLFALLFAIPPAALARASSPPNIVFILTDDLDTASMPYLSRLETMLTNEGMTFTNAYVDIPLCCPSRSSTLRGQYAHNTGVLRNSGTYGGFPRFRRNGLATDTVATRLSAAGYQTAYIGKYLNGYEIGRSAQQPGWDVWMPVTPATYYGFDMADGEAVTQPAGYSTDVLAERAAAFIESTASPFFLHLSTVAPHAPATPPARYTSEFSDLDPVVADRLRTMLAVEDLVDAVLDALVTAGALDDTYIFFTSDNGYHLGTADEDDDEGKALPWESDVRVPLLVRGPGIAAGSTSDELVSNIDLFPTFADLAGAGVPDFVDGRSFRGLLDGTAVGWRDALLIEYFGRSEKAFRAVRLGDYKLIRFTDTNRYQLYDLARDPNERRNILRTTRKSIVRALKARLGALTHCAADTCRAAEGGP